jgi:hypothetical protein
MRDPEEYAVVGRFALAVVGQVAFCDHCKNHPAVWWLTEDV